MDLFLLKPWIYFIFHIIAFWINCFTCFLLSWNTFWINLGIISESFIAFCNFPDHIGCCFLGHLWIFCTLHVNSGIFWAIQVSQFHPITKIFLIFSLKIVIIAPFNIGALISSLFGTILLIICFSDLIDLHIDILTSVSF